MKVLMIGGTGLVGPHVIQQLYDFVPDVEVNTITRSGKSLFSETAFKGDRHNEGDIERILQEVDPDFLIDMIPFNVEDATKISKLLNRVNPALPLIAVSSIDIYAAYAKLFGTENIDYQSCPISEDMSLRTTLGAEGEIYDKLNVERIYKENIQNLTVLRFPATYGWPDRRRVTPYLDTMLDEEPIIEIDNAVLSWRFSRCLHKNAAYSVVKAVEANQKGQHVYNVAEETPYSELEWCQKLAEIVSWKGKIKTVSAEKEVQVINGNSVNLDRKQDFYVETQKIRQELGFYEKFDPDEGLEETVRLYAEKRFEEAYKPCY